MVDVWSRVKEDISGEPIQLAIDPDGFPVFISRVVWQEHILRHHPEMNDYTDLILQAVATPVERETEDEEQKHLRYYAEVPSDRQPTQSKLRLRVVVKYVYPSEWGHQRTGLISSAYLVRLR